MKVFVMLISVVVVLALPMLTLSEAGSIHRKYGQQDHHLHNNNVMALLRGGNSLRASNDAVHTAAFLELRSMISTALITKARAHATMRSPASDMLVAVDHILNELRSDQKTDKAAHDKAWSKCKIGLGGVRKELFGEAGGINAVHTNLQEALRKKAGAVMKVLKTREALDEAKHLLQHTNKTMQMTLQAREFAVMQHETHLENEQRARLIVTKIQQYIQHSAPSTTPSSPSNENKKENKEVVVSEGQAELEGALTALELVEQAHQHLRKRSRSLSSSKDNTRATALQPVDDSSDAAIQANATLEANKKASHRTLGASLEMLKSHVEKSSKTLADEWEKATAAHGEVMMRLKHKMLDEKEAVYMATAALREAEEAEEVAQKALLKAQHEESEINAMNKGLTSPNETEVALAYASHTCNSMHKSALNREHVRSILIKLALNVRNEMEDLLKSILSKASTPTNELPKPVDQEKVDLAVTEAANEAALQKEKEAADMASGSTGMTGTTASTGADGNDDGEKAPAVTGPVEDLRNKPANRSSAPKDRLSEKMPASDLEDSAEDIEKNTALDDYMDGDSSLDTAEAASNDGEAREVMEKLAKVNREHEKENGYDDPSNAEDERTQLRVEGEDNK